ncbi:MAG: hypothetical protein Q8K32_36830 [Archangium sp.]|nr:hypothetical protein [Archangium sp.]
MAVKAKTKKTVARVLIGALVLVLVSIGVWWLSRSPAASLRTAIAKAFNRPLSGIEENVPVAANRTIGAVLVDRQGRTFFYEQLEVAPGARGAPTVIDVTLTGKAQAALLQDLLQLGTASAEGDLSVNLKCDDLVVDEIADLKSLDQKLLALQGTAGLNEEHPRVITRTYRGTITLTIRKTGAMAATWGKVVQEAVKTGAKLATEDELEFVTSEPAVFAFESLDVKYVSTTAAPGDPDAVEKSLHLVPLTEEVTQSAQPRSNVRYGIVGVDTYGPKSKFGALRMTRPSVSLVSDSLHWLGAVPALTEPVLMNPTREELESRLDALAAVRHEPGVDAVVVYVVGHAISGNGGQSYLVLPSHPQDVVELLGNDLFMGSSRKQAEAQVGGNLSDLLKVATAVASEVEAPPGLYSAADMYRRLQGDEEGGAPFALLLDSCFSHEQLQSLRQEVGLTARGDYFLPAEGGELDATREYSKRLAEFFEAPYLRSTNVVLFGAAPGTLAAERPNPRFVFAPRVAPLASRLSVASASTWGDVIRNMRDVAPLGEHRTYGTASWSDLASFQQLER